MYPHQHVGKYDLVIAYRVYPKVSKTPFISQDDKFKLVETGLKTLKASLTGLRTRFYFILDNCPVVYEDLITHLFNVDDVEFIRLSGEGNVATFGRQIDILLKQDYSDVVFFAEDDYIYRPALMKSAVAFLQNHKCADFVSPYDHNDTYTMPIHTQKHYEVTISGGLHWRTAASTCLTFLTRKSTLRNTASTFRTYCYGNWDSSLWFAITKFNVFNLPLAMNFVFTNRFLFKALANSWIHCFKQILLGRKYKLWQPVPSIATHMERGDLAPNIDWNEVVIGVGYEFNQSKNES